MGTRLVALLDSIVGYRGVSWDMRFSKLKPGMFQTNLKSPKEPLQAFKQGQDIWDQILFPKDHWWGERRKQEEWLGGC